MSIIEEVAEKFTFHPPDNGTLFETVNFRQLRANRRHACNLRSQQGSATS